MRKDALVARARRAQGVLRGARRQRRYVRAVEGGVCRR